MCSGSDVSMTLHPSIEAEPKGKAKAKSRGKAAKKVTGSCKILLSLRMAFFVTIPERSKISHQN